MSENVVEFPNASLPPRAARKALSQRQALSWDAGDRKNMQTFLFRSRELIVECDEADLIRDVSLNIDKAQTKLRKIKERLRGVQEQAAAQVQFLTEADAKLTAAIVAALLSELGER